MPELRARKFIMIKKYRILLYYTNYEELISRNEIEQEGRLQV